MSCSLTDTKDDTTADLGKFYRERKVPCSISHYHRNICLHCFLSGILSLDVIWTGKGYLTGSGSPPAAPSCGWRPVSQEPLLPPPSPSSSLRRAWLPACVLVIFIHPDLLACSWRQQSQSPLGTPQPRLIQSSCCKVPQPPPSTTALAVSFTNMQCLRKRHTALVGVLRQVSCSCGKRE